MNINVFCSWTFLFELLALQQSETFLDGLASSVVVLLCWNKLLKKKYGWDINALALVAIFPARWDKQWVDGQ